MAPSAADGPLAPTVLILGGFLTSPPFYRPLRRRLLARGAAAVVVANVWTPDWLIPRYAASGPSSGAPHGRSMRPSRSLPATPAGVRRF